MSSEQVQNQSICDYYWKLTDTFTKEKEILCLVCFVNYATNEVSHYVPSCARLLPANLTKGNHTPTKYFVCGICASFGHSATKCKLKTNEDNPSGCKYCGLPWELGNRITHPSGKATNASGCSSKWLDIFIPFAHYLLREKTIQVENLGFKKQENMTTRQWLFSDHSAGNILLALVIKYLKSVRQI
jgi:hypothetical protein